MMADARVPTGLPSRGARHPAPIRIAFGIDSLLLGGTETNLWRVATRLDPDRFSLVVAYSREGPLLERLVAAGIRTQKIALPRFRSVRAIWAARDLRRWIRAERLDVLHTHDVHWNLFGALALSRHDETRLMVSRRWGVGQYPRLLSMANRMAYARAARVLANAPSVAESLHREEGVPRARIEVVPNFADTALFSASDRDRDALRAQLGAPANVLLVGTVANLYPVKDQGTLLRAVAALPPFSMPVHVAIVGAGPSRDELRDLAAMLGIADRVHLPGALPDGGRFHRAFDVSTLTSLSEGFPNTLVEAMAARRPVVATDVGGVTDAVVDEVTGFVVPPRDYRAVANRLARLLGDAELRQRLGQAGFDRATAQFHESVVIPRLEAVYQRMGATGR